MTNVSVAIILNDDQKILIAQRKNNDDFCNYWEFPGGKINANETPDEALVRELKEELSLTIEPSSCIDIMTYLYQYRTSLVSLHFYAINRSDFNIELNVHHDVKWVDVCALQDYALLPGDRFISHYLLSNIDQIFFSCTQKCQYDDHVAHLLTTWFKKEKRLLPFRESKDPYRIWISEIMAQQTQIATLLPYYERFISSFPNINTLAKASLDEVYKHWEGLGYYSRAKNIHKCATMIVSEYNGLFPSNYDNLLSLPGIGPYTAGAISSIAFGLPHAAIDGNVLRVVTRLMDYHDDITKQKTKKTVGYIVESMMIGHPPGEINESLMELGASICAPSSPQCECCPISIHCQAYNNKTYHLLPIKKRKIKPISRSIEVLIWQQEDTLLFVKKNDVGLLSGLWGFPIVDATSLSGEAVQQLASNLFNFTQPLVPVGTCRHVFSHQIWNMTIYTNTNKSNDLFCLKEEAVDYSQETCFKSLEAIDSLTLSTAFSKALDVFKKTQKQQS